MVYWDSTSYNGEFHLHKGIIPQKSVEIQIRFVFKIP
jgi:hypothetical protein